MDWNISWFFLGGLAYLFVIVNLCRTITGKNKGWEILSFCSLSFGALTVLDQYRMVDHWLAWENMNSISNVVPAVSRSLTITVLAGILLNLLVLILNLKKSRR